MKLWNRTRFASQISCRYSWSLDRKSALLLVGVSLKHSLVCTLVQSLFEAKFAPLTGTLCALVQNLFGSKVCATHHGWRKWSLRRRWLCCILSDAVDIGADRRLVWLRTGRKAKNNRRIPACRSPDEYMAGSDFASRLLLVGHHAARGSIRDLHVRRTVLCSDFVLLHHLWHCGYYFCANVQEDQPDMR